MVVSIQCYSFYLFVCLFFFYQKCTLILKHSYQRRLKRKHQKSYFTSISSSILELVPEFKYKVDFSSGCLHLLDDQESTFECGYTVSSCEFTESNFYIFQTRVLIKIKHFSVKCFPFKPPDLPQKNFFYVLKYTRKLSRGKHRHILIKHDDGTVTKRFEQMT